MDIYLTQQYGALFPILKSFFLSTNSLKDSLSSEESILFLQLY